MLAIGSSGGRWESSVIQCSRSCSWKSRRSMVGRERTLPAAAADAATQQRRSAGCAGVARGQAPGRQVSKPFDSLILTTAMPFLGGAWLLGIYTVLSGDYSVADLPGDPQLRYLREVTLPAAAMSVPA